MGHAADGHAPQAHAAESRAAGGTGSHAADPHGGEIPQAPAVRSITPAPEDFVGLPGPSGFSWPLLWLVLAAIAVAVLLAGGWQLVNQDHGAAGTSAAQSAAPSAAHSAGH